MSPSLSIIIPTRERASYLPYAVETCIANRVSDLEILILDNASTDNTPEVAASFRDSRIRYERTEVRLSMRDNFEKGLRLARGEVLCFIGDDDGLLPNAADKALSIFSTHDVDAVSAARAHYYWPDLRSARRNTGLLPRRDGVEVKDAAPALRRLLEDSNYYRLPCLYHGFVKAEVVRRVSQRQGRFFIASQVDMFSSIAIASERIRFAYSERPLVINGGSSRSNGASHFGGGTGKEKSMWRQEDDLGFLPGFDSSMTIGSLIIESALRYCSAGNNPTLFSILGEELVVSSLAEEASQRRAAGRSAEEIAHMYVSAGVTPPKLTTVRSADMVTRTLARVGRLARSFASNRSIDMAKHGIVDVSAAARHFGNLLGSGKVGLLHDPLEQLSAAFRLARS